MIFIGLFLFIVFIVLSLNMYNHSNLAHIEDHLKKINCPDYAYSRGSYKAFCSDYFIEIKNSFIVDIDKNSKIYKYENITTLEVNQLNLIINNEKISFKEKDELDRFYKELSNKIK